MTIEKKTYLRVAVPVPMRRYFDYLPPLSGNWQQLQPGMRVRVPFHRRELVGIFIGFSDHSAIAAEKLKPMVEILDQEPVIQQDMLELCFWAANYYHYPVGEVLLSSLPTLLRQGKALSLTEEMVWCLTEKGKCLDVSTLKHAAKQVTLLASLARFPQGMTAKQLSESGVGKAVIVAAAKKEWISLQAKAESLNPIMAETAQLVLNAAQKKALDAITAGLQAFQVFLLNGVTGSGKTEVYLQAIASVLNAKKQVIILVPEIGLTPQTIQRFRERFSVPVLALHSALTDKERLSVWQQMKEGMASIVIGTRSAIFSPCKNLGLIVVDEEHDLSFKQQDSFRYHARDLAIMRAYLANIPVILGSATPALESLYNAAQGKFQPLSLPLRAGSAQLPQFSMIDIRNQSLEQGLSNVLLSEMQTHLDAGNQVMLFLNRRGFSPVLMCHACGWMAKCQRCDGRMTYHQHNHRLYCHHCDKQKIVSSRCEACGNSDLLPIGHGTERIEQALKQHFPDVSIVRIDRDSTQRKGSMEKMFADVHSGKHRILIGTQMLAKGHHFPDVTLVGVVDADGGLFSSDFRALERMGQLLLQVAGRAGRMDKLGKVMIQTHHPDHPLLHQLVNEGYQSFASSLLQERDQALLPPYAHFALFRAEAQALSHAETFLQRIKQLVAVPTGVQLLGPIPAPMAKRAGKYRAQLLLQSSQRNLLQHFLKNMLPAIESMSDKHRVRWSLDVDPMEMF